MRVTSLPIIRAYAAKGVGVYVADLWIISGCFAGAAECDTSDSFAMPWDNADKHSLRVNASSFSRGDV